jgi:hypothetical protein
MIIQHVEYPGKSTNGSRKRRSPERVGTPVNKQPYVGISKITVVILRALRGKAPSPGSLHFNMSFSSCSAAMFLTIVMLFSIGITAAGVIGVYTWMIIHHVAGISSGVHFCLIGGVIASVLLLSFGVYASCCGKSWARVALGVCLVPYVSGFIGLTFIVAFDRKSVYWVIDHAGRFWREPDVFPNVAHDIEKTFKCECWDNVTCLPGETVEADPCQDRLRSEYDDNKWTAVGILVAISSVMLAGAVCAFMFACSMNGIVGSPTYISDDRIDPVTLA